MSFPDLPDGYYLAELTTWRPKIFRRTTLDGESHWRGERDDRMPDPRTFGYALTPLSDITALAAMTARAEKAEAAQAWQPIDTSPRTNRARLVYCPHGHGKYVAIWEVDDELTGDGCWIHLGGGGPLRGDPTLWMPLPPNPPEDAQ